MSFSDANSLPNGQAPANGSIQTDGNAEENLWGSILDSVAKGKKAVPDKRLVVLGEPKTGKSTLLSYIASGNASQPQANGINDLTGKLPNGDAPTPSGSNVQLDLGLSYAYVPVGDEAEEETLALLSLYSLPSANPPYSTLLPLALPPDPSSLQDSIVAILLDWDRPWQFLESLRHWIGLLEEVLNKIPVVDRDEGKERVEKAWRSYTEPPPAGTAGTGLGGLTSTSTLVNGDLGGEEILPLPKGTLSDNLGVELVVICTKADCIDSLERDKDFKEEQFDYIQQVLRTICLTYGAGLFFTSHSRPESFHKLRAYILHRLFATQSLVSAHPSANIAPVGSAPQPATATAARTFPFSYRANVVDRDQVMVPAGWDSWGKIRILKEGFDSETIVRGWDLDLDSERNRRSKLGQLTDIEEEEAAYDTEGNRVFLASRMYEEVVADLDADDQPIRLGKSLTIVKDEQEFLREHYETLQKEKEKDPRAHFQQRGNPNMSNKAAQGADDPRLASVVGPMASQSLSLPSVERALDRDTDDVSQRMARIVRKESGQPNARSPLGSSFNASSPPLSSSVSGGNPTQPRTSPSSGQPLLSPGAAAAGGQTEVIANFFHNLLQRKLDAPSGHRNLEPNR